MKQKNKKYKNQQNNSNRHATKKLTVNHVRIIGGYLRRHNIKFIDLDGLRPTPDRMRETLFNWLMHDIKDAKILDTCAGSGVLGFESLSRGAHHVTFIEADKNQYQQLIKTADELKIAKQNFSIMHGKAEQILKSTNTQTTKSFDLIFLDPPYALNLWLPIIIILIEKKLADNETIFYIESDKPIEQLFEDSDYQQKINIIKQKNMGQVYGGLIQLDTSSSS